MVVNYQQKLHSIKNYLLYFLNECNKLLLLYRMLITLYLRLLMGINYCRSNKEKKINFVSKLRDIICIEISSNEPFS